MHKAQYFITGVWFQTEGNSIYISHVMLHPANSDENLNGGVKTSKDDVIAKIKSGLIIKTLRWDYVKRTWIRGAVVHYETVGKNQYLRTVPDTTVSDNLDNMINMRQLPI